MLHQFAEYKGVDPASVQGECYGLNHLSFFRNVTVDGEDIMPDLIHDDGAYAHTDLRFFEKDLVLNRGCVPNEYLYYFYYRERAVANVLSSPQTRGELIEEINREMTSELHLSILRTTSKRASRALRVVRNARKQLHGGRDRYSPRQAVDV